METLLQLQDGEILNFEEEHYHSNGCCETCDYGSSYAQDFTVVTSKGNMRFETDVMYDYLVSHDFLLKLILRNTEQIKAMTLQEFFDWMLAAFKEEHGGTSYRTGDRQGVKGTYSPK